MMNDEPSLTAAAAPVAEDNTARDKNNNDNNGDEMNGVAVVGGESSAEDQQKEQLQHQAQSESATAAASAASSETTANGSNDKKRKNIDPSEEELEQLTDKKKKKQKQSNANPKKKSKNPLVLSIRRELQQCCKVNDLKKAMQLYEDTKTKGIHIEAQTCYNLLNLCDGLGERPVHIGTPYKRMSNNINNGTTNGATATRSNGAANKDGTTQNGETVDTAAQQPPAIIVDDETRRAHAFSIKADMDEWGYPLTETAYTALIRLLAKQKGQYLNDAQDLLKQAEATQQCKMRLRLYSSLLVAYCQEGNMVAALDLWNRLTTQKLVLTEKEYASLMACAVQLGHSDLFERFLSELSEDVLIPAKETVSTIVSWFQSRNAASAAATSTTLAVQPPALNTTVPIQPMGPVTTARTGWTVDMGCRIDEATGTLTTGCLKGCTLQPVPLSALASDQMLQFNQDIVLQGTVDGHDSKFQGGGKGKKRSNAPEVNARHWNKFLEFLQEKYGDNELDVVLDGANIGYYKQNFSNAPQHVDYRQIDAVVRHFRQQQNKRVLLILHARHFSHKLLPPYAVPIVASWSNFLYKAAPGMNDDWFWLHAAVSRKALVVTNDEMRDHWFQMLAPRSFVRWKERYQVRFGVNETKEHDGFLQFHAPAKYSRRIQRIPNENGGGLVIPLAKRGDERRFLDGAHVAKEEEPIAETYVCIRPTMSNKEGEGDGEKDLS